jgi:hypothetical protein
LLHLHCGTASQIISGLHKAAFKKESAGKNKNKKILLNT